MLMVQKWLKKKENRNLIKNSRLVNVLPVISEFFKRKLQKTHNFL